MTPKGIQPMQTPVSYAPTSHYSSPSAAAKGAIPNSPETAHILSSLTANKGASPRPTGGIMPRMVG